MDITLYWQSLTPIEHDLTAYLHLLDGDLVRVGGRDVRIGQPSFPQFPTSEWSAGTIFRESYYFTLPEDAPLYEELTLVAGVYAEDEGLQAWPVTAAEHETIGDGARLMAMAALPEAVDAPDSWLADFGGELRLLRADYQPEDEAVSFDFEWYSQRRTGTRLSSVHPSDGGRGTGHGP